MSAIRSTENQSETTLRSHLHRLGLRFRKYVTSLPGRPDIVFPGPRVAVFVDGDFWHARAIRERGPEAYWRDFRSPNRQYWEAKFARRIERDAEVTRDLRGDGWTVVRVWESEVKADPDGVARRIAGIVKKSRPRAPTART